VTPSAVGVNDGAGLIEALDRLVTAHPSDYREAQRAWVFGDDERPSSPFTGGLGEGISHLVNEQARRNRSLAALLPDTHGRLWRKGDGGHSLPKHRWAMVLSVVCIMLTLTTASQAAEPVRSAGQMAKPAPDAVSAVSPSAASEAPSPPLSLRTDMTDAAAARVLRLFGLLHRLNEKYGVVGGDA